MAVLVVMSFGIGRGISSYVLAEIYTGNSWLVVTEENEFSVYTKHMPLIEQDLSIAYE